MKVADVDLNMDGGDLAIIFDWVFEDLMELIGIHIQEQFTDDTTNFLQDEINGQLARLPSYISFNDEYINFDLGLVGEGVHFTD